MAQEARDKYVKAGGWRTLETGWNAEFVCIFFGPSGARVKVRYGGGWPFGWNRQEQTLTGDRKTVTVGKASVAYARVQIVVQKDTYVHYFYSPVGP